jgi:cytochrome c-type biogenesis protein CcmH/NrfG
VLQDEPGRKWLPRWCIVAWLTSIGLHLNNEFIGLRIQWFGYYMMFLATFFFLPSRILQAAGLCVVAPAHWWHHRVFLPALDRLEETTLFWVCAIGSTIACALAITIVQLPGTMVAISLIAFALLSIAGATFAAKATSRLRALALASAVGLAAVTLSVIVAQSSMKHDYYYVLGTELQNLQPPNQEPQFQRRALAAYERASHFGPPTRERHVEMLMRMGMSSRRLGDVAGAVNYYKRAIAMAPDNVLLYLNLGVAYQTAGNGPLAFQAFRRAVEVDPQSAEAHHELGRMFEANGELDAALDSLRTAQRLDPNDLLLQQDIAALLKKRRKIPSTPRQSP